MERCPAAKEGGQEVRDEGRGVMRTSGNILIWQSIVLQAHIQNS